MANVKKYGFFDVIEASSSTKDRAVILFHGYGADARDLYPLAEYLNPPEVGTWFFPNAWEAAPGVPGGRAWYQIDLVELERAMQTGEERSFGAFPEDLTKVRLAVQEMIEEMPIDPENTIIGGFSQGAMLATDLFLNARKDFAGLMILSGTFLGENEWPDLAKKKKGAFLQSHGHGDPLLPFARSQRLYQTLKENGWQGKFIEFPGGHEIPPNVLQNMKAFISQIFASN